jgi:ComF family protein
MKSISTVFLDFFLPRFCPGCNKKLMPDEKAICEVCLSSILIADKERLKTEYDRNFTSDKVIKDFYSKYVFETDKTLQHIIHSLKYQKQFRLGTLFGEIISEGIEKLDWQIDLIIPVPIHHLKKAERGYNQSDYIAIGLSKLLKINYSANVIKRIKYTESQTRLHLQERAENVAKAFKVRNRKKVVAKNILLVDDIITTGATIQECGRVLINEGAASVFACSIGIAK